MNSAQITSLEAAVKSLQAGGVGVLPTDTVYGLATRADKPGSVARMYALKHREHKPGTVIAASIEQLVELGVPKRYLRAVEDFWPNPLSIVLPVGPDLDYLVQGVGSLAMRIPKDETMRMLLKQTGPLVTSSANQPGEPTAINLAQAMAYFGDTVDFYVDGGELANRPPSTVIRVVDDAIEVLRQGAVQLDENGYPIKGAETS